MTNVREIAYETLLAFDKGDKNNNLVSDVLDKYSYLDKQDRGFLARLVEGSIERMLTLDYVVNQFSKLPVNKMKPPVRSLIRMGAYQILYMDQVPDSAAVNESVKIARKRGLSNLSGFINGVLRNISRGAADIKYPSKDDDVVKYLSVKYSCPEWIVELLVKEQGYENAEAVLDNSVSVRPVTVRVNKSKVNPVELLNLNDKSADTANGLKVSQSEYLDYCIKLDNVDRIGNVDFFEKGLVTVQDLSSMLVCHIAGIKDSDVVIDVCASPGGKTLHAADMAVNGQVISCDVSDAKLTRIEENITRCGFSNVSLRCLDATNREEELIDKADVLIADVPCSGLGVMGRKNDIKYRLKETQLFELCRLQRSIIDNVVSYVKTGGIMMYSTCTVNRAENNDNVEYIKSKGFDVVDFYDCLPDGIKDATAHEGYLQLYGKNHVSDGFFIAKFVKIK